MFTWFLITILVILLATGRRPVPPTGGPVDDPCAILIRRLSTGSISVADFRVRMDLLRR